MNALFSRSAVSVRCLIAGWVASSPAIASLVFNAIVGAMYDRQANAEHLCVGIGCWHNAFVLMLCVAVVGLCISVAMTPYTRVGKQARRKVRSGSLQETEEGDGTQQE